MLNGKQEVMHHPTQTRCWGKEKETIPSYLFTGSSADHSPEAHGVPELVPALQKGRELGHPLLPKCPGEYLVFLIFFVFFNIIGQIPVCVCV